MHVLKRMFCCWEETGHQVRPDSVNNATSNMAPLKNKVDSTSVIITPRFLFKIVRFIKYLRTSVPSGIAIVCTLIRVMKTSSLPGTHRCHWPRTVYWSICHFSAGPTASHPIIFALHLITLAEQSWGLSLGPTVITFLTGLWLLTLPLLNELVFNSVVSSCIRFGSGYHRFVILQSKQ